MSSYLLDFQDIDKTKIKVAGGKGANMGEISKVEGIHVPDGFCISTEAFKRIIAETTSINDLLDRLSLLRAEDRNKISQLSGEIRRLIDGIAIPEDIHLELARHLSRLGEENAYAIRSSATAEDLPTGLLCGPAGYVFEYHWEGGNPAKFLAPARHCPGAYFHRDGLRALLYIRRPQTVAPVMRAVHQK